MDLDTIRNLTEFMAQKELVELEYEGDGVRIKLRRAEPQDRSMPAVVMASPAAPPPAPPAAGPKLVEFRSPLVGTFYLSMRPDADPFVQVGDEVTPEKVICIVEAMKVMNEIKAETKGRVHDVVAKNGQAVQFGEVLFRIEAG